MKCKYCGAEIPNDSSFCTSCGKTIKDGYTGSVSTPPSPPYTPPPSGYYMGNMPVSVGGWIGRMLIPYIPIVGWLVYLIMLFI